MSTDPLRAPAWWARAAVSLATYFLPRGDVRMRYRLELVAELWGLGTREQLAYAAGVLAHAGGLTRALRSQRPEPMGRAVPLRCRLRLWHTWRQFSTDDGARRYQRCVLCGRDRDRFLRMAY